MKRLDLVGQTFSSLLVIEQSEHSKGSHTRWTCYCSCGETVTVRGSSLMSGMTTSCGCKRVENGRKLLTKHGQSSLPEFKTWRRMMRRCHDVGTASKKDWESYGGRGIKVCEKWHSFDSFFLDMGIRPDGMSLDRIDVNGGYQLDNCRWATPKEQANNRRSTVYVELNGEKLSLSECARRLGFEPTQFSYLYQKKGLPIIEIMKVAKW